MYVLCFFFFKQKTAYEMRISDWSSDVCSSDLAAINDLKAEFADTEAMEHRARHVVEKMMVTLQGALLVRHSIPAVADAFCASRLGHDWGHADRKSVV